MPQVNLWSGIIAVVGVLATLFGFGGYLKKSYNIAKKIDNLFSAVEKNTKELEDLKKIAEDNREANRYFAANILYTRCHEAISKKDISESDYRYLHQFYKVYISLDGNSTISILWSETTTLARKCGVDVDLILKGA